MARGTICVNTETLEMKFTRAGSHKPIVVMASNLEEVVESIYHHFNLGHDVLKCPLCRWREEQYAHAREQQL